MKIVPVSKLRSTMYLAQNIYRHDSLLAIPKGVRITGLELETLQANHIDFVLVYDNKNLLPEESDLNFSLTVMEGAFMANTLLPKDMSQYIYEELERKIVKNKKIRRYINELRNLDGYSYAQCINIAIVVASILHNNQVDKVFLNMIFFILLHEIGKTKMKHLLNETRTLSDLEYQELRKIPTQSYELLLKAGYHSYDVSFVEETHEKYNGKGYPYGLKEKEISDLAQLVFIADTYNALSTFRPYRKAYTPIQVLQVIHEEKGQSFGPEYVDVFLTRFTPYQVGSTVELSDGSTGIVKRIPEFRKMLPVVEVITESKQLKIIDLGISKDVHIKKIIDVY